MRKKSRFDYVGMITSLLALMSFITLIAGLTELGETKVFWLVLGGVMMITAIGYSVQVARGVNKSAPFQAVSWFALALVIFALDIWIIR